MGALRPLSARPPGRFTPDRHVCTQDGGHRCLMRRELDFLVLGDCLLVKSEQPETVAQGQPLEFAPD